MGKDDLLSRAVLALAGHCDGARSLAGLNDQKRAVVDMISDGREVSPEAGILAALIKKLERREA